MAKQSAHKKKEERDVLDILNAFAVSHFRRSLSDTILDIGATGFPDDAKREAIKRLIESS